MDERLNQFAERLTDARDDLPAGVFRIICGDKHFDFRPTSNDEAMRLGHIGAGMIWRALHPEKNPPAPCVPAEDVRGILREEWRGADGRGTARRLREEAEARNEEYAEIAALAERHFAEAWGSLKRGPPIVEKGVRKLGDPGNLRQLHISPDNDPDYPASSPSKLFEVARRRIGWMVTELACDSREAVRFWSLELPHGVESARHAGPLRLIWFYNIDEDTWLFRADVLFAVGDPVGEVNDG